MRYLKKLKEEITTKYSKKIQKESATEEQKTEYENAKKELEEKEKGLVEPNKSFLFRLFRRKLYKKQVEDYNKGLADIESAKKRASSAGLVIEQKETAVQQLQEKMQEELAIFEGMDLEISRNAAVKQPALLDNDQYKASCKKIREYIDEMIRIDPNLVNDVEFMSACVEFDMNLITLDKTNDSAVYQTFLEQYKEFSLDERKLLNEGYSRDDIERVNETYTQLMQELTNPAYVSDGKFKIPHRFIFERIRTACAPDADKNGIGELCDFAYTGYKKYDGKLSQAEGERLISLYEDENSYLYAHSVNYKGDVPAEKQAEIVERIEKEGLLIPSEGDLAHTTINTQDDAGLGFLNLLNFWTGKNSIIVAQVPKAEIDGKKPIIGFADAEPTTQGKLLPKYIIGSVKGGVFAESTATSVDMVKYALLASDGNRPTKVQQLTSN